MVTLRQQEAVGKFRWKRQGWASEVADAKSGNALKPSYAAHTSDNDDAASDASSLFGDLWNGSPLPSVRSRGGGSRPASASAIRHTSITATADRPSSARASRGDAPSRGTDRPESNLSMSRSGNASRCASLKLSLSSVLGSSSAGDASRPQSVADQAKLPLSARAQPQASPFMLHQQQQEAQVQAQRPLSERQASTAAHSAHMEGLGEEGPVQGAGSTGVRGISPESGATGGSGASGSVAKTPLLPLHKVYSTDGRPTPAGGTATPKWLQKSISNLAGATSLSTAASGPASAAKRANEEIAVSQTPQIRHMKRQLSRMASRLVELDITSATPAPLTSRSGSGGSIGSSSMGRATSFLAQQAAAFPSPRLTASSAPSEAGDSVLPQPSWAAEMSLWKDVEDMTKEERLMGYEKAREAALEQLGTARTMDTVSSIGASGARAALAEMDGSEFTAKGFATMYEGMRQQAAAWAHQYGETEVDAKIPAMSQAPSIGDALLKITEGAAHVSDLAMAEDNAACLSEAQRTLSEMRSLLGEEEVHYIELDARARYIDRQIDEKVHAVQRSEAFLQRQIAYLDAAINELRSKPGFGSPRGAAGAIPDSGQVLARMQAAPGSQAGRQAGQSGILRPLSAGSGSGMRRSASFGAGSGSAASVSPASLRPFDGGRPGLSGAGGGQLSMAPSAMGKLASAPSNPRNVRFQEI